jgi:hypothetical protein
MSAIGTKRTYRTAGESPLSEVKRILKLRKVIADAVAKGGTIPKSFIAAVFDEART